MEAIFRILYTLALRELRSNCKCGVDDFDCSAHKEDCQFRVNVEACEKETMRGDPDPNGAEARKAQIDQFVKMSATVKG